MLQWHRKSKLPVSGRMADADVHKLDKQEIEVLPAIPIRQR